MKNRVAQILSLGMALAALPAMHAQNMAVKADVPFDFYVGSTLMPHGAYLVNETPNNVVAWIMATEQEATKAVTTISILGTKREEPARLVFHRYGEDYFLEEIWKGDSSAGRYLPRSAREKEMARGGAGHALAVIQVALHR